mgnify:CR=1 FL=1|tara:strand:- start:614 stop:808 length:195 start_codon:yes stop_codon:yes gene_type:complete
MKVIATNQKNNNQVIFTWNDDLDICDFVAIGVPHDEVDNLIDTLMLAGVSEGGDYKEWVSEIKL